jgi:hypothetical protein
MHSGPEWENISAKAKDMIDKMLILKPEQRPSAE